MKVPYNTFNTNDSKKGIINSKKSQKQEEKELSIERARDHTDNIFYQDKNKKPFDSIVVSDSSSRIIDSTLYARKLIKTDHDSLIKEKEDKSSVYNHNYSFCDICKFNGRLYMAWKGTRCDQGIWFSSTGGGNDC
jgi:hypothetical protein